MTSIESIILEEIKEARKDIKLILLNGCSKAKMHDDIDTRVRSLELDRAKAVGAIAIISAICGVAGAWMAKKLGI